MINLHPFFEKYNVETESELELSGVEAQRVADELQLERLRARLPPPRR